MIPDVTPPDDQNVFCRRSFVAQLLPEVVDGFGSSDHDNAVTRFDTGPALRNDRSLRTHDRRERQRLEMVDLLDRPTDQRTARMDLELGQLDGPTGEDIEALGGRQPGAADGRPDRQQIRPDHEVDAEDVVYPIESLDVLHTLDAGDRRDVAQPLGGLAGQQVDLVTVGARHH